MDLREFAESLLFEEESPTLDFKREQYKFEGASDIEKAELLKDILAFANAWRRSDAYILLGVEEVRGAKSTVVGIADHIDVASLQQFVNAKTNRPVTFSYFPLQMEDKQVAIIAIPRQDRPTFLLRNYGGLAKDTVYIRRGTSTDVAKPDEIARMGVSHDAVSLRVPRLSAFLVTGSHDEIVESSCTLTSLLVDLPSDDQIPSYGVVNYMGDFGIQDPGKNERFYRNWAHWVKADGLMSGVRIAVRNSGNAVATNVKVVLTLKGAPAEILMGLERDRPLPPSPGSLSFEINRVVARDGFHIRDDIVHKALPDGWRCTVFLSRVQAKDVVVSRDRLFVGSRTPCQLTLEAETFSDDLPDPVKETLQMNFIVERRALTPRDIVTTADNWVASRRR